MITVITMYRGDDAEILCQVVEGRLTDEQKQAWRDAHDCDQPGDEDEEDTNNMFFREFKILVPNNQTDDLWNVDGDTYSGRHTPAEPPTLRDDS